MNLTLVVCGVAVGLFGWLIYWAGLPVIGGVVGAGAGASLGFIGSGLLATQPLVLTLIGAVVGGALGVVLMKALQLYFFFITGASLGGTVAWNIAHTPWFITNIGPPDQIASLAIIAAGAVLGGLVLVRLRRYVIALITSMVGAILLSQGVPVQYAALALVVGLVVFLSVQIGLVRRFVNQTSFDRHTRRQPRNDQYYDDQE